VTAESVARALAGALGWLAGQDAPERVIATTFAGRTGRGGKGKVDREPARRWIRRLLDQQDAAGSWSGDLLDTAATLLTILELREAGDVRELDPAVGRGLAWIAERRGAPGAWTDGCSPARHRRGLCHHFAGGFFSPAPPEVPLAGARLPSGAGAEGDLEVRFVSSVVALRCLLQWQEPGTDALLHLEALRRIVVLWPDDPPEDLTVSSLLAAIRVLLLSPIEEDLTAARQALRVVAGKQRGDGSWVETEPFQALDVFTAADVAGIDSERTHRALWHGARLLIATQHADGSWGGEEAATRRALIACRTLRQVDPGAPS
jgi:hypothetical protein